MNRKTFFKERELMAENGFKIKPGKNFNITMFCFFRNVPKILVWIRRTSGGLGVFPKTLSFSEYAHASRALKKDLSSWIWKELFSLSCRPDIFDKHAKLNNPKSNFAKNKNFKVLLKWGAVEREGKYRSKPLPRKFAA